MIELFAEFFRLNKYVHYEEMLNKSMIFIDKNPFHEDVKILFGKMDLVQYHNVPVVEMKLGIYVASKEAPSKIEDVLIRFDLHPNKCFFYVKEATLVKIANMYNSYYYLEFEGSIPKSDIDLVKTDKVMYNIGGI